MRRKYTQELVWHPWYDGACSGTFLEEGYELRTMGGDVTYIPLHPPIIEVEACPFCHTETDDAGFCADFDCWFFANIVPIPELIRQTLRVNNYDSGLMSSDWR